MTRISSITLTQQQEQHTLTIRKTINFMTGFSAFALDCFDKTNEYLSSIDSLFGGEPIVCFHNMDLEHLDVEIGFPVANHINGSKEIKANLMPSQRIVSAIDLGPYEQQDPTLEDIFTWIQQNGYEMQGTIYYQYLNDTNRPASEFLTKMILPII